MNTSPAQIQASLLARQIAEQYLKFRQKLLKDFDLLEHDDYGFGQVWDLDHDMNHRPKPPHVPIETWDRFEEAGFVRSEVNGVIFCDGEGEYLQAADDYLSSMQLLAPGLPDESSALVSSMVAECRTTMKAKFLGESIYVIDAADVLFEWTQRWKQMSQIVMTKGEVAAAQPAGRGETPKQEQEREHSVSFQVLKSILEEESESARRIPPSCSACEKMRRLFEAEREHALDLKQIEWAELLGVKDRTLRPCSTWKEIKRIRGSLKRAD